MKFWLGVLFGMLVISPIPEVFVETIIETEVVYVSTVYDSTPTPILDSMIDLEEQERQGKCLWQWMKEQGVEFTLNSVLAAGYWTDELGGACLLIGEDDE